MVGTVGLSEQQSALLQFMSRPLSGSVWGRLRGLAAGGPNSDSPEAKMLAAREFAALLFSQMLKELRKTSRFGGDILDGGHAQRVYEDMLDDQLARQMAQNGQIGLVRTIYEDLVRMDIQKTPDSVDIS